MDLHESIQFKRFVLGLKACPESFSKDDVESDYNKRSALEASMITVVLIRVESYGLSNKG